MTKILDLLTRPSPTAAAPTQSHIRRNDIFLLGFVLFCLFLGWGIRGRALDNSQRVDLGDGLPAIAYPVAWFTSRSDNHVFQARNPASASAFKSEINIAALPIKEGETLESVRTTNSFKRNQELERYRELTAEIVTVQDRQPGILITYAFIADPTRDSGATGLPVVVEAQDLIFRSDNQWLVVTVAADANDFVAETRNFDLVFQSLNLERSAE